MQTTLLSLALVVMLAACTSTPPSGSGTGADARECQTLRGMMGRGNDERVEEACMRQLGAEGCRQCLSGGK